MKPEAGGAHFRVLELERQPGREERADPAAAAETCVETQGVIELCGAGESAEFDGASLLGRERCRQRERREHDDE